MDFIKDPLLWINWGAAAIGIFLLWKFGPDIEKVEQHKGIWLFKFWMLTIAVGGCMYLSKRAGDLQLIKLGFTP